MSFPPFEGMLLQLIDGSIQGCNEAAEIILGVSKEQMQGWTFENCPWQTVDQNGAPFPAEQYPARVALRTGRPSWGTVLGLYHPNGKLIWLRVNAQPLFQAGASAPYAVISTFIEVAKPKPLPDDSALLIEQGDRALHQNQVLHEAIFNESTDALFLVDPATLATVDCNQRAVELFEASSKDELIGIQGPSLHRYPLTPEQRQAIVTNMRTGVWIGEIEYLTRRGRPFWGNLAAKSIQAGDRSVHMIRITDITPQQTALLKRQQAEAALYRSQVQLQQQLSEIEAIYQSAPIGLAFLDTNLRYVRINQRLAEINGAPVEIHLGHTVRDILPELADTIEPLLHRVLETGEPLLSVEVQGETLRDPGVRRTWLESFLPLRSGDTCDEQDQRIIGVSIVCEEITQRKQAELEREKLLERERTARAAAEKANHAKDEFLAVLSHELRSPLNPILGWTKLLQKREFTPGKARHALEIVERNAKLLVQLIDDLLDMARIMQGKLVLNFEPVSLPDVVAAAIETVRFTAESKLIRLEMSLPTDFQPINGDLVRLQQIVWNLLSNAVKFTPEEGRVMVRLTQDDRYAELQVEDTGKGISPEFLPYLFERFQQQDSSTARQFGGLGLGLAITQQLVELHHGAIAVASPGEGRGATFTVRLPLMQAPVQSVSPAPLKPSNVSLAGIQVLVVDDETDSLELIKVILEQEGAIATTASSARQALDLLVQSQFEVIISDIGMPEVDGYEFLRQVRALPPQQNGAGASHRLAKAIALTAYVGERDQQKALEAGYHIHLPKPFEPSTLIAAIATLIRS